MESWRQVWRNGFLPGLPTDGLVALAEACRKDDPRLTQGSTTTPPPLMCVQDRPVEAADAVALVGAATHGGFGQATVGECEEFFARACFEADQRLGGPAECRWFLNFWDDAPRPLALASVLEEVELELGKRGVAPATVEG